MNLTGEAHNRARTQITLVKLTRKGKCILLGLGTGDGRQIKLV